LGLDRLTNQKILEARGTQCFLFRSDKSGVPISPANAFSTTLPALLYKIQRPGENLASQDPTLNLRDRYDSPYTPHSLRVSLITAFIVDGGAPISVVSKLVGHSTLVMTIYYTKPNSKQLHRVMAEAEKRSEKLAMEADANTVREQGLNSLRDRLIATDGNGFLFDEKVPNSACVVFDHGICPRSASACEEGGALVFERPNSTDLHAAVEAGYLGKKNCPRCRFFITGVPFLGGLIAVANEVALEIHTESKRYQLYTAEIEQLERDFYDSNVAGETDSRQQERKQASANQQLSAAKLDGLLSDYVAINRYVQDCVKLVNEIRYKGTSNQIRLVLADDGLEANVTFEESKSQYHLLAEICQNATIYRSANPSRAIPLISQVIDRMVENNGLAPMMFRLSDDQKLVVANELTQLLIRRLGSWDKIDDLFCGDLTLLDLDALEPNLTKVSVQIGLLLDGVRMAPRIAGED
jgi:hypothetical protein